MFLSPSLELVMLEIQEHKGRQEQQVPLGLLDPQGLKEQQAHKAQREQQVRPVMMETMEQQAHLDPQVAQAQQAPQEQQEQPEQQDLLVQQATPEVLARQVKQDLQGLPAQMEMMVIPERQVRLDRQGEQAQRAELDPQGLLVLMVQHGLPAILHQAGATMETSTSIHLMIRFIRSQVALGLK